MKLQSLVEARDSQFSMSLTYQDMTLDDFFARWNSIFLAYICYYVTVVETRQRVNDQMHSLTTDTHTHQECGLYSSGFTQCSHIHDQIQL